MTNNVKALSEKYFAQFVEEHIEELGDYSSFRDHTNPIPQKAVKMKLFASLDDTDLAYRKRDDPDVSKRMTQAIKEWRKDLAKQYCQSIQSFIQWAEKNKMARAPIDKAFENYKINTLRTRENIEHLHFLVTFVNWLNRNSSELMVISCDMRITAECLHQSVGIDTEKGFTDR